MIIFRDVKRCSVRVRLVWLERWTVLPPRYAWAGLAGADARPSHLSGGVIGLSS